MEIEALEKNLERQLGWVRASETRLSLVLPLATALFGSIAVKIGGLTGKDQFEIAVSVVALILITLSFLCAAAALYPRTTGPSNSVVFFGGICAGELEEFIEKSLTIQPENLKRDLATQIYINADIAAKKYGWMQKSMSFLMWSLIPWAVAVIYLYGN